MTKIQELYESSVRPMVPADRLQLARLILDDLAPSDTGVDVSDEWSDDDLADVVAFSARHASQPTAEPGAGDETR
jgi:hypothetical protein